MTVIDAKSNSEHATCPGTRFDATGEVGVRVSQSNGLTSIAREKFIEVGVLQGKNKS